MKNEMIHLYSDNLIKVISPSQWTNAAWIIIGVGSVVIKFPLLMLLTLIKILDVYYWRYEFHERTLMERRGILKVTRRELHYYRIKSIKVEEPFWMRLFGLANVTVLTSDPYLPELVFYAVRNGNGIRNELRGLVYQQRKDEGVREFDMFQL